MALHSSTEARKRLPALHAPADRFPWPAAWARASRWARVAEASLLLSASAHPWETVPEVARRILPALGDLCIVDLLDEQGLQSRAAVHHRAARQVALEELLLHHPHRPDGPQLGPTALRRGRPILLHRVTPPLVAQHCDGDEHSRMASGLGLRSALAVPLVCDGQTFGVITLGITRRGRRYGAADLQTAEALAGIVAGAAARERLRAQRKEATRDRAELQALFDLCPTGLAYMDRDLRFVRVNAAAAEMNGVPVSDLVGRTYEEALPWFAAQIPPIVRRVLESGEPVLGVPVTARAAHIPDSVRHRRAAYHPVWDADGTVTGVAIVVTNVTESVATAAERERLLAELAAERELLQAVIEQMPAAVGIVRGGTEPSVHCNARLAGMWPEAATDGAALANQDWVQTALRAGESIEGREVLIESRRPHGGVLRVSSAPVRDAQGRILAGVITAQDITEQRRASAEAEQALARMRALIAASPLPTVAKDAEGHVTVWNRAAEQTFGWTEEEVLGRPLPIVPEDRLEEYQGLRERIRHGERLNGLIVHRQRRDGTVLPVMLSVSPVQAADGTLAGTISMYADLTERTRILQTAAHELRSPIAGVKVVATLLGRRAVTGAPADELARMAHLVEHEADRLTKLSGDLLAAFRLQEGQLPLHPRRIDLREVAGTALRPFQAGNDRHRFILESPADPAWVWGDADRLEEVVGNLLGNAVKYSPDGGDVSVRVTAREDGIHLSVSDTGIGIPADQLNRVFEAFFRASNVADRDPGGMGLGLYVCADLVRRHGGTISAESPDGGGATFRLRLPRHPEERGPGA